MTVPPWIPDVFVLLFLAAVVYVLVRPGSKGQDLVKAAATLMESVIRQATDLAK